MYTATKRLEMIPLKGNKKTSIAETEGLVLKYYKWRYQMRQEPCFAVAGNDEYLSEFSRKESGCVYIPLDILKNYKTFRLVMGRKGARKTILFTDCHIEDYGIHKTFYATCEPLNDEATQPKEVPAVLYWKTETGNDRKEREERIMGYLEQVENKFSEVTT